jgi:hypothetical protein
VDDKTLEAYLKSTSAPSVGGALTVPKEDENDWLKKQLELAKQQDKERLNNTLLNAVQTDPNLAAEAQKIGGITGVPPDVAERNMEQLKKQARLMMLDQQRAASRSPVLARQLQGLEFAKIAQDQYEPLSATESLFQYISEIPRDISEQFEGGRLKNERGYIGQKVQAGELAAEEGMKRIGSIDQRLKALRGGKTILGETAGVIGQMTDTVPAAATYGAATGLTTGSAALIAGQMGPQIALPEEILTVPTAAIGGFWAGFSAKMAEQTYKIEAGNAYADMIQNGIDRRTAQNVSAGVGLVNAGLETVGLGFVAAPFKKALITEVTKDITNRMLVKPTLGMAVKEFSKSYALGVGAEVTTELLQEVSNITGDEIARRISRPDMESKFATPEGRRELATQLTDVFEATVKGMVLLGIAGPGVNFRSDYKNVVSSERQVNFLQQLTQQSTDSVVRERNPNAFENYITAQAEGGPAENIYVDSEQLVNVLKQSGLTIDDLKKVSPEVAAQVEQGVQTGDDVVIPTSKYAAHIAGTDLGNALMPHMRVSKDGLSVNELQEFNKNKQSMMDEAKALLDQKMQNDEAFVKEAKEVEAKVFDQIKGTKIAGISSNDVARNYAQFVRDFVVTQAADMKMMPSEFFNQYMYQIESGYSEKANLFNQEGKANSESAAFKAFYGNSVFKNEQGAPVVLYHGTADDVTEFDVDHPNRKDSGWLGTGVYLTDSVDLANMYADQKARTLGPKGQNVMPLYARMENPYYATAEDKARVRAGGRAAADQFSADLQAQGYDGVIYQVAPDAREMVVFDPAAVKSQYNSGTWSRENQDILAQGQKQQSSLNETSTPSDSINFEEDSQADDIAAIDEQANIPETVDAEAVLDAALKVAQSQVWNKGRDLKMAIQTAVQNAAKEAGVDVSVPSPQTTEYLVRVGLKDALFALEQNPNAIGWYDEKTRQALAVMALVHPEIATNEDARFAFTWALAVTSNGLKVDKNFELAEKAYSYYKQNKVMPTNIKGGQAQGAINDSLQLFNDLVAAWGMKNLRLFMQTNFTVGEISSINKELKPGGEHADTTVKGSAIIGPKIGNGFFSNLYGDFSSLTMDRWLVRTWGRWTGTLIKSQPHHIEAASLRLNNAIKQITPEQAATLTEIIGVDVTSTEVGKLAEAIQKASMQPELRERMNEFALGEEVRKAGNSLAKYIDGQKEAPAGPHERTYIRSIFNEMLSELKTNPAYADLTMADLQAVLWYAEKRLYESAKDNNVDEESTEGYSDEDAPDYANAAAGVARSLGVSDRKINNALKKESKDERARRTRLQNEQEAVAGEQQAQAGGFTSREKRLFAGAVATRIARSNRSGDQKQSWSYSAKSSGDGGKVRLLKKLGVTYAQEWKAGAGLARVYRNNGITVPKSFYELDQGSDKNAARFTEAITASKQASGDIGAAVYVYPAEDYKNMRLFLSDDGLSGVAVKPDGDIVSVFSQAGAGRSVMELAIAAGGTKLDAFETILPEFYAAHGFVAASRLPWDDTQAPEGWNKGAFSEFNGGEPNVVFMALDQSYFGWHGINDGKKSKTYDDAVAEQNRAVKRNKKRKEENGKPTVFYQSGSGAGGVQRLRASDLEVTKRYGTGRDGAISVIGIHYSKQPRSSLTGAAYGTGLKGAEASRLAGADPRLSQRIHFYVDTGNGIRPEGGVGGNVQAINLDNLYDASADPLGFKAQAVLAGMDEKGTWFNAVESAIIDAGFDGVYIPSAQGDQGVAVLLGPQHTDVQVEQHGTHGMPAAGANAAPQGQQRKYAMLSAEMQQFEANKAAIQAAAPSAMVKSGNLIYDAADADAVAKFFPSAKSSQLFNQPERGGFDPKRLTTILSDESDLSTFLHETGHFFLTVYSDMAGRPNATQRIKDDMQAILDWFGIKDLETWNAMSLEEQRKYHEQWAYNFEIYLFEGKSPNVKMQTMFEKFAAFLRRVYQSIRDDLNAVYKKENGVDLPMLTSEISSVMDRMLASEEQITQAEQVRKMIPTFATQEQSGMDDNTWAAYQEMAKEAHDQAVMDLTKASARQVQWLNNARSRYIKEMQKKHDGLRKQIRDEVTEEVNQLPVYVAMEWLKRGNIKDENGQEIHVEAGNKLNLADVKALFPESKNTLTPAPDFAKLGYGKYGMLSEDGLHPDMVAAMPGIGFTSGEALVRALIDAKPIKEAIEERTDQRMLEEHGELSDPKAMERAVEAALHNEARARFVAVELRFISKATSPVRVMLTAAKQVARQIISGKKLEDIKPNEYNIAESRASKAAIDASKKGETEKAAQAKQNQLVQNQLATEAIAAQAEVQKALNGFKRFFRSDEKMAKNRDMDLISAARTILAYHGLGKQVADPSVYVKKLQQYNPDLYAEIEPMIERARDQGISYEQLTLEEFRALRDTVEALWYQSTRDKQIMIDGKIEQLDDIEAVLNARLEEIGVPLVMPGETQAPSSKDRTMRMLNSGKALLRRVEHWANSMDGAAYGKNGNLFGSGPFTKFIWRPVSQALDAYRVERNKYVKRYVDLIEQLDLPVGKIEAPELNYTFGNQNGGIGKAELLGALLHMGNQSNFKKLLIGRKWGAFNEDGSLDASRWSAFFNRMIDEGRITKKDMDFVQAVWDLNEEIKPMAQKAHHDLFGYYFKEVEADALTTPWGTYRGGYVPAKTDAFIVRDAQRNAKMEELESDFRQAMPSTGLGFTKGRVEYNKALTLDIRTMTKHIDDVIRFAMVQPAIKDALKIIRRRDFADNVTRIDPNAIEEMILPWLNRAARQITTEPGFHKGIDTFWSGVRSRTGVSIMFANISNAMQQLTGHFVTATQVQGRYLKSALVNYMTNTQGITEDVAALSPFMANRLENQMFEIQENMNDLLLNPSKYEKVQKWSKHHAYFLQTAFQNQVDVVAWTAAYNQAMAEAPVSFSKEEATKEAIAQADSVVRRTQGSLNAEDISAFEVGSPFYKTLIQFSGWANMMANLNGTDFTKIFRDLGWRGNKGKIFMQYLLGFALPMLMADAIVRTLGGGWDDEDNDGYLDVFMEWFFGSQIRGAVALVPFGTNALVPFNAFNDKAYDDRMTTSPSVSTLEAASVGVVKAGINIVSSDKEVSGKNVRDVLTLLSLATGIPLTVLGRPIGYEIEVQRGNIEPTSAIDYARGLITGKASGESKQK